MFTIIERTRHGDHRADVTGTGDTIRAALDDITKSRKAYLRSGHARRIITEALQMASTVEHGWSTYILTCECGNAAEAGLETCEYCTPHDHDHEPTSRDHAFGVNMLCRDCGLLAQDCCEVASQCPGYLPLSQRR